jgi:hypothetical protein
LRQDLYSPMANFTKKKKKQTRALRLELRI